MIHKQGTLRLTGNQADNCKEKEWEETIYK